MTLKPPTPGLSGKVIVQKPSLSQVMQQIHWGPGRGRKVLYKTHVIATIPVILDISCMFVTMVTDSARNLVCWALGSSITAMWCQFGPLGAFLSLCLSPPAPVCLFIFVSVCPQPVSGPLRSLLRRNSCSCILALPTLGPPSVPPGNPWCSRMDGKAASHKVSLGGKRARPAWAIQLPAEGPTGREGFGLGDLCYRMGGF